MKNEECLPGWLVSKTTNAQPILHSSFFTLHLKN